MIALLTLSLPAFGQDLPPTVYVEDVPATINIEVPSHIVADDRMRLILEQLKETDDLRARLEQCGNLGVAELLSCRDSLNTCRKSYSADTSAMAGLQEAAHAAEAARRRMAAQRNVMIAIGVGIGVGFAGYAILH